MSKSLSLLEKAKAAKTKKVHSTPDADAIELAVGWARGEVAGAQVCQALGIETRGRGSFYLYMARALAAYVRTKKKRGA